MAKHSEATGIHRIYFTSFADASARNAYSATAADVGKVARQEDNDTYWLLTDDSPLTWKEVTPAGTGGGGLLQEYIENGGAEDTTIDWVAYANTSASNKPDDFGGTPSGNVTFTRSTADPGRGLASWRLDKTASDEQGEGFYYEFSIEDADLASVLRVLLEAKVAAGTYADGDVRIYLVSSNDSFTADFNVIEPAPTDLLSSSLWLKQIFEAQTDASDLDYRLCIHVASTSASAYTVDMDSISAGVGSRVFGTPISDWESFTPTGSWSTNTTYTGYKRRVGGQEEYFVRIDLAGAPDATPLTVNLDGTSIDTAKVPGGGISDAQCGTVHIYDTGATWVGYVQIANGTTDSIQALYFDDAANELEVGGAITDIAPITLANTDYIILKWSVPIAGWSSNTQISDDADTRVVSMHAHNNGGTALTSGVTDIDFTVEEDDTHAAWDGDSFTVPVSGFYHIETSVVTTGSVAATVRFYLNGSDVGPISSSITSTVFHGSITTQRLDAGDVITLRLGNNATLSNTSGHWISISRVSGPAQIAASETVAVVYEVSASTANANFTDVAVEIIDYDTLVVDTHNSVATGVSWAFTAPKAGLYRVSASLKWSDYTNLTDTFLVVYKNGSEQAYLESSLSGGGGSAIIQCQVGDTIDIRALQNDSGGSARSIDTGSHRNVVSINSI